MQQLQVSSSQLLSLYQELKQEISQHQNDYPLAEGLEAVFSQLHLSHRLYIFSSNKKENIESYLDKFQIKKYFQEVYEDNSYFDKAAGLQEILKINQISPTNAFYFGDETRDIEAANNLGINSVAVTWGYEGLTPLSRVKPSYVLRHPSEILTLA